MILMDNFRRFFLVLSLITPWIHLVQADKCMKEGSASAIPCATPDTACKFDMTTGLAGGCADPGSCPASLAGAEDGAVGAVVCDDTSQIKCCCNTGAGSPSACNDLSKYKDAICTPLQLKATPACTPPITCKKTNNEDMKCPFGQACGIIIDKAEMGGCVDAKEKCPDNLKDTLMCDIDKNMCCCMGNDCNDLNNESIMKSFCDMPGVMDKSKLCKDAVISRDKDTSSPGPSDGPVEVKMGDGGSERSVGPLSVGFVVSLASAAMYFLRV